MLLHLIPMDDVTRDQCCCWVNWLTDSTWKMWMTALIHLQVWNKKGAFENKITKVTQTDLNRKWTKFGVRHLNHTTPISNLTRLTKWHIFIRLYSRPYLDCKTWTTVAANTLIVVDFHNLASLFTFDSWTWKTVTTGTSRIMITLTRVRWLSLMNHKYKPGLDKSV